VARQFGSPRAGHEGRIIRGAAHAAGAPPARKATGHHKMRLRICESKPRICNDHGNPTGGRSLARRILMAIARDPLQALLPHGARIGFFRTGPA
jgi:hypothetical protein